MMSLNARCTYWGRNSMSTQLRTNTTFLIVDIKKSWKDIILTIVAILLINLVIVTTLKASKYTLCYITTNTVLKLIQTTVTFFISLIEKRRTITWLTNSKINELSFCFSNTTKTLLCICWTCLTVRNIRTTKKT